MKARTVILVASMAMAASSAVAQDSRPALLRAGVQAYESFQPEQALDLLRAAINPALGAPDADWERGVQLLAQILIEEGQENLAGLWARWATRLSPGVRADTVEYLSEVVAAFRTARAAVGVPGPGDEVTGTSWVWAVRRSTERQGRLRIDPRAMPVPVNVLVPGIGLVAAGQTVTLAPGSYELQVGAQGYAPVRVTRDVLPGVTTVLAFSLSPSGVATDVLPDEVRQRAFRHVAALSVRRYESEPVCAAGAFLSRDGLLLTSYSAVRGAGTIAVEGRPGQEEIRVAAYDAAQDLVVLQVPVVRVDSLLLTSSVTDGQYLWGIRMADCRTPAEGRVRMTEWQDRPRGTLGLSDFVGTPGAPLIDAQGRLAGVWKEGTTAAPASQAMALLEAARRNAAQRQVLSLTDMARRENHLYGSVTITADVGGAQARVTPLEAWHWPELAAGGQIPFTFRGPMGRYLATVTGPNDLSREQEFTIRPNVSERVGIVLRTAAAAPAPGAPAARPAQRRGGFPWIIAVIGGGGAAAAAVLLAGGTKDPPPDPIGGITITVPNPP